MPLPSSKIRLVYILAASHSGSTLLAMLLGAHPQVCTVGEIKATSLGDVDKYRCSCRQKIYDCPFWRRISDDMARRGLSIDFGNMGTDFRSIDSRYARVLLKPLHRDRLPERIRDIALALSPVWRKRSEQIRRKNVNFMDSILAHTGKRVIVDSSKVGIRLKYLLKMDELDVRVVRVVRDGRAVALTYIDPVGFADARDPSMRGGGSGGERESERLPMEQAAREWRHSNEEAESILRQLDPGRWMEARYEDLCRSPETILRQLFDFIGVDSSKVNLRFRQVQQHVIGNGMRLDDQEEIRLDDRWKASLSGENLKMFDLIAGAMNRKLGYQQ
jgi:hypothetical protein